MTSTIICGKCKERHATVADVRACYAEYRLSEPLPEVAQGAPSWDSQDDDDARLNADTPYPYTTPRSDQPVTEAGMYNRDGVIYKVQRAVHGSGHLYAKRLVRGTAGERASFEYAPGVVRQLTAADRLTLELAKEYGALYGTCCVCGAVLTNETSIEAGIGPVCAGRL